MLTAGVYIGIPVMLLILIVLAVVLRKVIHWDATGYGEEAERKWTIRGVVTVMVAVAIIFTCFWWPFDMTYHRWTEKSGTVETSERRMLGNGKSMSEMFVVKFKDDETLYRCDDTRCALAKPGKEIRLLCKPEWEYAAVDGWVCRYGQKG